MENIADKIVKFSNIYKNIFLQYIENNNINISNKILKEIESLEKEIISFFLQYPGDLIEFENEEEFVLSKKILDILWENIFEYEITFDVYVEKMLYNLDIVDRIKLLKPTMLLKERATYNKNFEFYFKETMKAWLLGLDNASIVLCAALLEDALEEKLSKIHLDYQNEKYVKLIEHARFLNIVNDEVYEQLNYIRRVRNACLHNLETITFKKSLDIINKTKKIIETIYSK